MDPDPQFKCVYGSRDSKNADPDGKPCLEVAHGGDGEGGVPQAPPQEVPHAVRRQVSQAPDILHVPFLKKPRLV